MFDDDMQPKKTDNLNRNLEPLSLDELSAYIDDLKEEIARTESEIQKKKTHMDSAASIFKS